LHALVGLLALSYQGWRDDPSVVLRLSKAAAAVPARLKPPSNNLLPYSAWQPARSSKRLRLHPMPAAIGRNAVSPASLLKSATETGYRHCRRIANLRYRSYRTRRICCHGRAGSSWQHCDSTAGRQGNRQRRTNERGEWVIVPDSTIAPGDHSITLNQATSNGTQATSDQSVALTVPDTADGQPLIVLSEASKPSRVLQKPEAPAKADAQTTSDPETKVAVVEQQPASEPQQPAGAEQAQSSSKMPHLRKPRRLNNLSRLQETADTKPATADRLNLQSRLRPHHSLQRRSGN
jgi:hypothetical protein